MDIKTLYISYFGIREPLVQTQVVAYLREIASGGVTVHLVTFEPNFKQSWTPDEIEEERKKLAAGGIKWHALAYHKSPSVPATLYDVAVGARFIRRLVRREGIDVLHARGHIPVLMASVANAGRDGEIIFDIRGLVAEEYADAGIFAHGSPPFRAIKWIEKLGLEKASQIVVLTNKMRDYLVKERNVKPEIIEVIPCCVDFSRIENAELKLPPATRFELIYAGSVSGLYLLEEMCAFFLALKKRQPDAFFRILTKHPAAETAKAFQKLGIGENDYEVLSVKPSEVGTYIKQASLAISFRKSTFAQIAASPTKIPEYLAVGVPVVSNAGIGDTDALIENEKVGVTVSDLSPEGYAEAVDKALALLQDASLAERCVRVAHAGFDLKTIGKNGYLNVYKKLSSGRAVEAEDLPGAPTEEQI
ncbi:MAG TPA: glycosyltransferase [Pyrinomonadaceae bacterium]|jgi:glycosyltransferase involved in cell wall biosynthesis